MITTTEPVTTWERLAADGTLGDAVVEYVRRNDWVTFPELQRQFTPFTDAAGTFSIEFPDKNVILWTGLSESFTTLIGKLVKSKRLHFHVASFLSYLVDGAAINLPIAKRVPDGGYAEPHWLPVCLRVVPMNVGRATR